MNNKAGFTLFEVLVSSMILVILLVPALRGLAGAFRTYKELQNEEQTLEYTKQLVSYYQELFHGESQPLDKSGSDLSADSSTVFSLKDSTMTGYTYTRSYIGPVLSAYYVAPSISTGYYDAYLFKISVDPTSSGGTGLSTAFVVAAYYDNQLN